MLSEMQPIESVSNCVAESACSLPLMACCCCHKHGKGLLALHVGIEGQILCVAGTGVVCARRTGIALCSAVTHVQGGPGLCCAVFVVVSCGGWREIHSLDFSHTSGISLFLPCFFLFARRHQERSSVAVALPVLLPACPPALRLMLKAFCTDSLRLPVCGPSGPYKVLTTAWPMHGVSCTRL